METNLQPQGKRGGFGRLRSLASVMVFDIAGPVALYEVLRWTGQSQVPALILSGLLPAIGVGIGLARTRQLDVIGALVLAGIVARTVLGLASHSPQLVLAEGTLPTVLTGLACLVSLWSSQPLVYRMARQFAGPRRGQELEARWPQPEFRHAFRVITIVWAFAYLAEAVIRIGIVYSTSTGTALTMSGLMPFVITVVLLNWTVRYVSQAALRSTPPAPAQAAREAEPVAVA